MTDLKEEAGKHLKTLDNMKELKDLLTDKEERPKSLKEMGPMELIKTLAQLWATFQEAMKTGDWQTLGDALNDFQNGKNPVEGMADAATDYRKELENVNEIDDLLNMYNDPYGKIANTRMGKDSRYRIKLKSEIKISTNLYFNRSTLKKNQRKPPWGQKLFFFIKCNTYFFFSKF